MSDLASYQFFSWFRAGVAGAIQARDPLTGGLPARAPIGVDLKLDDAHAAHVDLAVIGPGDVRTLDSSAVLRTVPRAGTVGFEPNHLAAIELRRPDLPWAMTPARATEKDQLRPWICLVVVRQQDGVDVTFDTDRQVHMLSIGAPASPSDELPELGESWAWAHVQILGGGGASVADVVAQTPERALSRLICPRRLRPDTRYRACIVPTFAADPGDPTRLVPAWARGAGLTSIRLPVYYFWDFSTGAAGDFASLARALQSRVLPATVGVRSLNLEETGFGVSSKTPVVMPGVLRAPGAVLTEWPANERKQVQAALGKVLLWPVDKSAVLAPPTYGRWLAGAVGPTLDPTTPAWLRDLNLDPRMRAFAGAGARVIEKQQEALLAQAWDQLGDARRANRLRNLAQLTRGALTTIVERRFGKMSRDELLPITAPLHWRLLINELPDINELPVTERNRAVNRTVTLGDSLTRARAAIAVAPAFRRAVRPRGPLARRAAPLRPRVTFAFMSRLEQIGAPTPLDPWHKDPPSGLWDGGGGTPGGPVPIGWPTDEDGGHNWPSSDSMVLPQTLLGGVSPALAQAAVSAFLDHARPGDQPQSTSWAPTQYEAQRAALDEGLSVDKTVVAALAARIASSTAPAMNGDPLEPILFTPTIDQPMFAGLRDESRDFILPGMDGVPPDTLAVLEVDAAAIEAYLIGVNHAFNWTLRWRDYPTDRGTALRQFWDARGRIPAPADAEAARDVDQVTKWGLTNALGANLRGQPDTAVVLLIRGRLLQRYPDTVIYAVQGIAGANNTPTLGTDERHPLYRGTLDPDVTIVGFDLTRAEARGAPGWFFVLQQQPTAPQFGLEDAAQPPETLGKATAWDQLAWGNLVHDGAALDALGSMVIKDTALDTSALTTPAAVGWGKDAASMAYITLRNPVRWIAHGSVVIPKDP